MSTHGEQLGRFLHIEWSGYWDFPDGQYVEGSKAGDEISGFFDPEHIKLGEAGAISYEIDPGQIAIPNSNSWDFTLINRAIDSGVELYPFEYITTLGRTQEYGGGLTDFGDLFIRASIPDVADKPLFKGLVKTFSYSKHGFSVTLNCENAISILKDSNAQMFINHDFSTCNVVNRDGGDTLGATEIIAQQISGTDIQNVVNHKGDEMELELIRLEIESDNDVPPQPNINPVTEETHPYLVQLRNLDKWSGDDPQTAELAYWSTNSNNNDTLNAFVKDPEVKEILLSQFENDLFLDRFIQGDRGLDYQIDTTGDQQGAYEGRAFSEFFTGFIKIENSTILTQYRIALDIRLELNTNFEGDIDLHFISDNRYHLEVVHAVNGMVETTVGEDDKDKDIYERGRFFKEGDTYDDSIIQEGDEVTLNLIDWSHDTSFRINEENNPAIASDGWSQREDQGGPGSGNVIVSSVRWIIHGSVYGLEGNTLVIYPREGFFDNIQSLIEMLEENFINRYTRSFTTDNQMFDISAVERSHGTLCFIADLVHYGWNNDLNQIVVDTGQQIASYLYLNEKGEVVFLPRESLRLTSDENLLENLPRIERADYEVESGVEYSYGDRFYTGTYSDQVEINNVEGEDELTIFLNSNGELIEDAKNAQDIDINNYRTSDLGVPATRLRTGTDEERILRESPNNLGSFVKPPIEQASTVADGINYPSELFTINLAIHSQGSRYRDIGVGDYVYIKEGAEVATIYLVKKASYKPIRFRNEILSVTFDLFEITEYHVPELEQYDETFTITEGESQNQIAPVRESYEDEIAISDTSDDGFIRPEVESHEDRLVFNDNQSGNVSETALNPPSSVEVSSGAPCEVNVDWSYISGVDHYEVQYQIDGGVWRNAVGGGNVENNSGHPAYIHGVSQTPFQDGVPTANYRYRVRSVDSDGNETGWTISNTITVAVQDC